MILTGFDVFQLRILVLFILLFAFLRTTGLLDLFPLRHPIEWTQIRVLPKHDPVSDQTPSINPTSCTDAHILANDTLLDDAVLTDESPIEYIHILQDDVL